MTHPFAEEIKREARADKAAADAFIRACQSGDAEALYQAVDGLNLTIDGWRRAMRKVTRHVQSVAPDIQEAFAEVWRGTKMLPLHVGDNRALCDAIRILLPPYHGPAVRLFRGAGAAERRRQIYGLSWTADPAVAERFARERQVMDGGSLVLETMAGPEAIIHQVEYPDPFTAAEIEEFKQKHPRGEVVEFHKEREYLIDRRRLGAVGVVTRYRNAK